MPRPIQVSELARSAAGLAIVDVRREAARLASGKSIPGALRFKTGTSDWTKQVGGRPVAVFCVHGHEDSQNACDELTAAGVDARYLEGGFEAWREAGLPVADIDGSLP